MINMDTVSFESTTGIIILRKSARVFHHVRPNMFATRNTQDPAREPYLKVYVGLKQTVHTIQKRTISRRKNTFSEIQAKMTNLEITLKVKLTHLY